MGIPMWVLVVWFVGFLATVVTLAILTNGFKNIYKNATSLSVFFFIFLSVLWPLVVIGSLVAVLAMTCEVIEPY